MGHIVTLQLYIRDGGNGRNDGNTLSRQVALILEIVHG